jgi:DNA-directed RNA polymerase specialized sigma24 family protein
MRDQTDIGGRVSRFPTTRRSAVLAAGSQDRAEKELGFELLVEAYWKPVYKYVRLRWRADNEGGKDLTQGFFARAFEKDLLRSYDSRKGSFRNFLRVCLDGHVANERKAARDSSRGAGCGGRLRRRRGSSVARTRTTNTLGSVTLRLRVRNGAPAGSPQTSEPARADEGGAVDAGADSPPSLSTQPGIRRLTPPVSGGRRGRRLRRWARP